MSKLILLCCLQSDHIICSCGKTIVLPFTEAEVGVEVGNSLEVVREHDVAEDTINLTNFLGTLAHFGN